MSKTITNINDARIGRIIRLERKVRNLTQTQVANAIGIDQSTYAQYESGKRPLPPKRVTDLADAYGIATRYINPEAA